MSGLINLRFVGSAQVIKIASQAVSIILLARLLSVHEVGLVAIIMIVVNFSQILRDSGVSAIIIQKKDISPDDISSVFSFNVIFSFVLAVFVASISGLISNIYGAPELKWLLIICVLVFPISGVTSVYQALLEKNEKFQLISRVEVTASLFGVVVVAITAYMGAGAFSVVFQQFAVVSLSLLSYFYVKSKDLNIRFRFSFRFSVVKKGFVYFLFNVSNYISRNFDNLIVGKWLGTEILGFYSQAYKIMTLPLQVITGAITRISFPVLSRLQNDKLNFKKNYFNNLKVISFASAPMMAGLWWCSHDFVIVVLGRKWDLVSEILYWLAPTGYLQSLISSTGVIFMANGKMKTLFALGVVGALILLVSIYVGVHHGIETAVLYYFIGNFINAGVCFSFSLRQIDSKYTELISAISSSVFSAIAMLIALWVISRFASFGDFGEMYSLATNSIFGAMVYFLAVSYLDPNLMSSIKKIIKK